VPKISKYIIKIVKTSDCDYGKYYDGGSYYVSINNAKSYDESYLRNLSLIAGIHQLIKIENDGELTIIR
jgi:hypothetical protein